MSCSEAPRVESCAGGWAYYRCSQNFLFISQQQPTSTRHTCVLAVNWDHWGRVDYICCAAALGSLHIAYKYSSTDFPVVRSTRYQVCSNAMAYTTRFLVCSNAISIVYIVHFPYEPCMLVTCQRKCVVLYFLYCCVPSLW